MNRTDVDARITLDTELLDENRLSVTVEAALNLSNSLLCCEPKLHLDIEFGKPLTEVYLRHHAAGPAIEAVAEAPFVDAHFAAHQVHSER